MEYVFPSILAKSCIRSDLLECIKTSSLRQFYLDEPVIENAISEYILVRDSDTINPACLTHSQRSEAHPMGGTKFLHAEHTVSDYFKSWD